jgi:hypothetical protein
MKSFLFLNIALFLGICLNAQELIFTPLNTNPQLIQETAHGMHPTTHLKINGGLHLPFIDDFSRNHLTGSESPYWEDRYAFINPTYGIDPPTIGVATLEGLNELGYPYDFDNPNAVGICDYLTSRAINLSEDENGIPYVLADSIILSFYYQAGGLGTKPLSSGKLTLEFFDPELEIWIPQWFKADPDNGPFEQVFVKVDQERFLHEEFQFRFVNEGRRSGNLDHWNIDVVYLNKNRNTGEEGFNDLGFQFPVSNLLDTYTAVPYKHYKQIGSAFMGSEVDVQLRNNYTQTVLVQNIKMRNFSNGSLIGETPFESQANNIDASSSQSFTIQYNGGGNAFNYPNNIDSAFARFYNEFVFSPGAFDLIPENDTIGFTQYMENYYAYDDGSAENGLGLTVTGEIAMRFQAIIPDSLIGMKIYFNPRFDRPVDPFTMIIFGPNIDNQGPGASQFEQGFNVADFNELGHDIFSYYFFEEPQFVSGEFYIGLRQIGDISLNVGYDRNTDNLNQMFYRTGINWQPLPSGTPGSLMIRPVFQSELDSIIFGIDDPEVLQTRIYPNPANDRLFVQSNTLSKLTLRAFDSTGKLIATELLSGNHEVNISDWPTGFYILHILDEYGNRTADKLIVNR